MLVQSHITIPTAFVILDFDNFLPEQLEEITDTEIQQRLFLIVKEIIDQNLNVEEIIVRFYGGWYKDGGFSTRASLLLQKLSQINIFPYTNISTKTHIKGRLELATSLFDLPTLIWDNTLSEKDGINRIRIRKDKMTVLCDSNTDQCPAHLLGKFIKKKNNTCRVSSCSGIHREIFTNVTQKMVDNMIACDFLSLCNKESVKLIYVISDDTDHFPSFMLGATSTISEKLIILGFNNKTYVEKWEPLFSQVKNIQLNILTYVN